MANYKTYTVEELRKRRSDIRKSVSKSRESKLDHVKDNLRTFHEVLSQIHCFPIEEYKKGDARKIVYNIVNETVSRGANVLKKCLIDFYIHNNPETTFKKLDDQILSLFCLQKLQDLLCKRATQQINRDLLAEFCILTKKLVLKDDSSALLEYTYDREASSSWMLKIPPFVFPVDMQSYSACKLDLIFNTITEKLLTLDASFLKYRLSYETVYKNGRKIIPVNVNFEVSEHDEFPYDTKIEGFIEKLYKSSPDLSKDECVRRGLLQTYFLLLFPAFKRYFVKMPFLDKREAYFLKWVNTEFESSIDPYNKKDAK